MFQVIGAFLAGFAAADLCSDLATDEEIVFFPTIAAPSDDGSWNVFIHGWVFEPERDSVVRATLLSELRKNLELANGSEESELFVVRARWFLVDNERGKRIVIRVGDTRFELPESEPNGHFQGEIKISGESVPIASTHDSRVLKFQAVLREADERAFEGQAFLLAAEGVSVISDIDDTIKISEVDDAKKLLSNTFLKPLRSVEGMAEFYANLGQRGASFHYVTATPWQLYKPLAEFCRENRFPVGTWHMKYLRAKDPTFFNLFAEANTIKWPLVIALLEKFPQRRFVLVGDSGEHDPEIYGEVARKHPQQVRLILIRDVTGEDRADERYKHAFDQVPEERWVIFRDASELGNLQIP